MKKILVSLTILGAALSIHSQANAGGWIDALEPDQDSNGLLREVMLAGTSGQTSSRPDLAIAVGELTLTCEAKGNQAFDHCVDHLTQSVSSPPLSQEEAEEYCEEYAGDVQENRESAAAAADALEWRECVSEAYDSFKGCKVRAKKDYNSCLASNPSRNFGAFGNGLGCAIRDLEDRIACRQDRDADLEQCPEAPSDCHETCQSHIGNSWNFQFCLASCRLRAQDRAGTRSTLLIFH